MPAPRAGAPAPPTESAADPPETTASRFRVPRPGRTPSSQHRRTRRFERRPRAPRNLLLATAARAAAPVTGDDFDPLAAGAVNGMRLHPWTAKARLGRDEVPRVHEASIRSLRAEPRTGDAWFAGRQLDAAIIGSGSLGSLPLNGQGLLFAGAAHHGWQGSVSVRGDWRQGVTADGSFVQGLLVDSGHDTGSGGAGLILSVQHVEGAAFGAVIDERGARLRGDRDDVRSAVRALLQPEAAMERAGARDVGVPLISIERIGAGLDPWAEAAPGAPAPPVDQLPLALDDIGRLGLRVRVTPELAPSPGLRLAEGGFSWIGRHLAVAQWAGAWQTGGDWTASGEACASVIATMQDSGDEGLVASLSVAHNVPDTAPFVAIPDTTVWGLSFTYGPLELPRAAVPVLASQRRHGR